mgnify:CR=1 FL=1
MPLPVSKVEPPPIAIIISISRNHIFHTSKTQRKILAKYIKDMSSETPDVETFLFVKENDEPNRKRKLHRHCNQ